MPDLDDTSNAPVPAPSASSTDSDKKDKNDPMDQYVDDLGKMVSDINQGVTNLTLKLGTAALGAVGDGFNSVVNSIGSSGDSSSNDPNMQPMANSTLNPLDTLNSSSSTGSDYDKQAGGHNQQSSGQAQKAVQFIEENPEVLAL